MAVDLKSELTRPLVLILTPLAALGWVLFGLSSWSTAAVQKTQRLQIIELSEKSDRLGAELSRQVAATGSLSDLEKKVAATRDDLTRASQAKNDMQAELSNTQRSLASIKRDLSDVDRNVQSQTQKLTELQTSATEAAPEPVERVSRSSRRGRWSRRGRSSRSYSTISRSR